MKLSPETYPVILCHEPAASDAVAATGNWISLENADGVLITITEVGTNATDAVVTIYQGTAASGTTALTTNQEFQIWSNLATDVNDTMVRRTDAATYTITATVSPRIVCIYVSAASLTPGYKFILPFIADGHSSNIMSITYQLDGCRYQQTTPPTTES